MTKIDELIESIRAKQTDGWLAHQDFQDFDIEEIMKQYAEYYAKICMDILLDETFYHEVDNSFYCFEEDVLHLKETPPSHD